MKPSFRHPRELESQLWNPQESNELINKNFSNSSQVICSLKDQRALFVSSDAKSLNWTTSIRESDEDCSLQMPVLFSHLMPLSFCPWLTNLCVGKLGS